eukprot:TRINITY_DN8177_c0_g1_i1.p1 TRINITY_DN8177_c0_g1~~TRINITY_DN8177_c0_g1_i1.p1  ORF type:complete len:761 (-),score=225.90 TRINITY_DN8177_c0_g1_i1:40-2274(-)
MDQLIPIINKLQDVFNTIEAEPVDLPQIVVLGAQSSGKSSVLENIVGRDFLPRGSGIVTRRPLVLQLINISASTQGVPMQHRDEEVPSADSAPAASAEDGDDAEPAPVPKPQQRAVAQREETAKEWGEFLHIPNQSFTSFSEIRNEIVRETDRMAGKNKGVSSVPINLKIYSPNVLNLTLVDLPGMTKVPVGDQPHDIDRQIRNMVVQYISKPNAIILAVTAANTDLANSDALRMAREVDPEGLRTVGVITKVDIMDKGTDAMDVLTNRVYPLKLGYVGVVNRSQADINSNKAIRAALSAEQEFFSGSPVYRRIAGRMGTPYLTKTLNKILIHHIQRVLPELRNKIAQQIMQYEQELKGYGNPLDDGTPNRGALLLHLLTKFCQDFRQSIDGVSTETPASELYGGARISYIFHETFASTLDNIDPCALLSEKEVRTAIRNATGPRPSLFVPEASFELLVRNQISRLEAPSQQCVDFVFEEMLRIVGHCESAKTQEFSRFPHLREKISEIVTGFLRRRLRPTTQMVSALINIELAYINTNHPDFIGGGRALSLLVERVHQQQLQSQQSAFQQQQQQQLAAAAAAKGGKGPVPVFPPQQQKEDTGGILSFFFGGGREKKAAARSAQTAVVTLQQPPSSLQAAPSDGERDHMETELIQTLLTSYFNIVRKNIQDSVPKTIMHFLVNCAKDNIQNELVSQLYREELFDEMLAETMEVVEKRRRCREMLGVLRKAHEIVNEVRDTSVGQ